MGLHLGYVPHDAESEAYREVLEVTRNVCRHLTASGQSLHLETGQEPADVLLKFLKETGCNNLFVNFDPANMILYGAGEAAAGARAHRLLRPPAFIAKTPLGRTSQESPGGQKFRWAKVMSDMACQAMKAGTHVFCEKPMALSTTDCARMVRTSKSTGKGLFIGHVLPKFVK